MVPSEAKAWVEFRIVDVPPSPKLHANVAQDGIAADDITKNEIDSLRPHDRPPGLQPFAEPSQSICMLWGSGQLDWAHKPRGIEAKATTMNVFERICRPACDSCE
jgi:hypothetical protein